MNKFKTGDVVYSEDTLGTPISGKVLEVYGDFYVAVIMEDNGTYSGRRFMYEDEMFFSMREYWENKLVKLTERINVLVLQREEISQTCGIDWRENERGKQDKIN